MTDQLFTFLSTLIGAGVGGALAIWGAIKAVRESTKDLELVEIRRRKVECVSNLSGLRFVVTEGPPALDSYKSQLMFEMNRIPTLWCDDPETLKALRDFYADQTNERFINLIRCLGRTTKFPLENLSDADLRNTLLLPLSGR